MAVSRLYREQFGDIQNPGTYRDTLQWQRPVVTEQTTMGEDVVEWQTYCTARASVNALTGRELEAAQQRWADARYQITHAYVSGLHREMRINWYTQGEARLLDVLDIADKPGTGRYLTITARDHVD